MLIIIIPIARKDNRLAKILFTSIARYRATIKSVTGILQVTRHVILETQYDKQDNNAGFDGQRKFIGGKTFDIFAEYLLHLRGKLINAGKCR